MAGLAAPASSVEPPRYGFRTCCTPCAVQTIWRPGGPDNRPCSRWRCGSIRVTSQPATARHSDACWRGPFADRDRSSEHAGRRRQQSASAEAVRLMTAS